MIGGRVVRVESRASLREFWRETTRYRHGPDMLRLMTMQTLQGEPRLQTDPTLNVGAAQKIVSWSKPQVLVFSIYLFGGCHFGASI